MIHIVVCVAVVNEQSLLYPAYVPYDGGWDGTLMGELIVGNVEIHANNTIEEVRGLPAIFTAGATATMLRTDYHYDIANHDDAQGAWYIELMNSADGDAVQDLSAGIIRCANNILYRQTNLGNVYSWDGTTAVGRAQTDLPKDTVYKVGVIYDSVPLTKQIVINRAFDESVVETDVKDYDGAYGISTELQIPQKNNSHQYAYKFRNVRRYDTSFDESKRIIDMLMRPTPPELGKANGFTLGTGAGGYNDAGEKFIAYPFTKDATAGMDIVSYYGTGSPQLVPHNLGAPPEWMMIKVIEGSERGFQMYAKPMGATHYADLSNNAAYTATNGAWNDTEPTATHFSVGTFLSTNEAGTQFIAYLFRSITGFSKVFSFTGNANADGPFVHCGFKPAFILMKPANATYNWWVLDVIRDNYVNPLDT